MDAKEANSGDKNSVASQDVSKRQSFQTFVNNFSYGTPEASKVNKQLVLSIGSNQFVKFKDDTKQTILIESHMPAQVFANTIQTDRPIDTRQELFYFETKIRNCGNKKQILVGISDRDASKTAQLGTQKNSYAYRADGKILKSSSEAKKYGPVFGLDDIIGCGVIMSKRQMFFTVNGIFQGIAFENINIKKDSLYPSVCLQSYGEEIQVNFGRNNIFMFDVESFKNTLAHKEFESMTTKGQNDKKFNMHDLVRQYLIHFAFVETLQAVEEESIPADGSLSVLEQSKAEEQKMIQKELSQESSGTDLKNGASPNKLSGGQRRMTIDETHTPEKEKAESSQAKPQNNKTNTDSVLESLPEDDEIDGFSSSHLARTQSQVSAQAEEYVTNLFQLNMGKKSESTTLPNQTNKEDEAKKSGGLMIAHLGAETTGDNAPVQPRLTRSKSTYVPPKISEYVINKTQKDKSDQQYSSSLFLKERGTIRYMIQSDEIEQARQYLKDNFKGLYDSSEKVRAYLHAMEIINLISNGNISEAILLARDVLGQYAESNVKIPTTDSSSGQIVMIDMLEITALFCYPDPMEQANEPLVNLLKFSQKLLIADLINEQIIAFSNRKTRPKKSKLETMFKQLSMCQDMLCEANNGAGRRFKLNVD